jgi:hypothetical protein
MLSSEGNRTTLRQSLLEVAARRTQAMRGHRLRHLTVDVDSLPIEVHGHQPGSEYNGHYHARIYHPLVASLGDTGDLLDVRLRKGAAHTAEGALDFILPLLDRVEEKLCQVAAARIEATSFVSPKWVPQMADAAEVFAGITRKPGVHYPVLVPNEQGYERARGVGVEEIAVFSAAARMSTAAGRPSGSVTTLRQSYIP